MRFKFCSILLLCTFSIMSCDDGKVQKLNAEIDQIHDTAMKDHADMLRVGRSIKEFMMAATMTPDQSAKYIKVIESIDHADADMSNWMAQYKSPEGMAKAEALIYLEAQKKGIEKNHQDILAATAAGKQLMD